MLLNKNQLLKLSDLLLDLSKGMFLSSLAAPAISSDVELYSLIRMVLVAVLLATAGLKMLQL